MQIQGMSEHTFFPKGEGKRDNSIFFLRPLLKLVCVPQGTAHCVCPEGGIAPSTTKNELWRAGPNRMVDHNSPWAPDWGWLSGGH